jgi:hypothetical protein
VQQLYAKVDNFGRYPLHVIPIMASERIDETGFFPGNPGLWNVTPGRPLPRWPLDGVMIVGHNYDCEESFRRAQRGPRPPEPERRWPSFRWLRLLLEKAEIQLEDCFYTNFFVGLKAGAQSTGPFPGRHDVEYVGRCCALLLDEIRLQRPTLLLTLGQAVLPFMAKLEPLRAWSGDESLHALDEHRTALLPSVQFKDCPHPTTAIALTHPGYWPRNVIARRYGQLEGGEAEHALLRAGVQCSGYTASACASEHNRR